MTPATPPTTPPTMAPTSRDLDEETTRGANATEALPSLGMLKMLCCARDKEGADVKSAFVFGSQKGARQAKAEVKGRRDVHVELGDPALAEDVLRHRGVCEPLDDADARVIRELLHEEGLVDGKLLRVDDDAELYLGVAGDLPRHGFPRDRRHLDLLRARDRAI